MEILIELLFQAYSDKFSKDYTNPESYDNFFHKLCKFPIKEERTLATEFEMVVWEYCCFREKRVIRYFLSLFMPEKE